MAINKDVICKSCEGRGGPAEALITCKECDGSGVKVVVGVGFGMPIGCASCACVAGFFMNNIVGFSVLCALIPLFLFYVRLFRQIRQLGPMIQQTQGICPSCKGQGRSIEPSKRCKGCGGKGVCKERKILQIFIEKGAVHHFLCSFLRTGALLGWA